MRGPSKVEDYRKVLQQEFEARCRNEQQYSLRKFAKDIGLSPGTLSETLNNNVNISPSRARVIARKLEFSPERTEWFYNLVASQAARSKLQRMAADARLREIDALGFDALTLETHKFVADWSTQTLYALVETDGFTDDVPLLAKRLGISVAAAQDAWDRLVRLGLVTKHKSGWRTSRKMLRFFSDTPSDTLQQVHRQFLQKAQESLVSQSLPKREINSIVMSIHSSKLKLAKEMLIEFQKRFIREVSDSHPSPDSVYCLGTQFFSLLQDSEVSK